MSLPLVTAPSSHIGLRWAHRFVGATITRKTTSSTHTLFPALAAGAAAFFAFGFAFAFGGSKGAPGMRNQGSVYDGVGHEIVFWQLRVTRNALTSNSLPFGLQSDKLVDVWLENSLSPCQIHSASRKLHHLTPLPLRGSCAEQWPPHADSIGLRKHHHLVFLTPLLHLSNLATNSINV